MVPLRTALLVTMLLLAACSSKPSGSGAGLGGSSTSDDGPPATGAQPGPSGSGSTGSTGNPVPSVAGTPVTSKGWEVTVYYTAVATLHTGKTVRVTGCPTIDCEQHKHQQDLGTFPESFVQAVKDEGTGRSADNRYLNWSYDTGYWMDTQPRDTAGRPLQPWQSAAADPNVLRAGSRFTIVRCGHDESGQGIDAGVCAKLAAPHWVITDEFTPGLGGKKHIDVYIGEETGANFTDSALYTTLQDATLAVVH